MSELNALRSRRHWSVLAACCMLLFSTGVQAEWFETEKAIMGTAIGVQAWHDDKQVGEKAVAAVIEEMHRIDRLMSTYKPASEISRVNDTAALGPAAASDELRMLIRKAEYISELTGGAFDITYASVGFLYDFRQRVRPDAAAISDALPSVNFRFVMVDDLAGTVSFAREGVRIDLGGIAKGYAVERGIAILREHGVLHGLVSAGGDTRVLGDRLGRPWRVGIRDPRQDGKMVALLPLKDEAISTSGDYERFFEAEGVRYHHIINPGTGKSAALLRSATVVGPDATLTDALSTSVFVLGVEEGLGVINGLDNFEAVLVDNDGRLHFSHGFSRLAAPE